MKTRCYDNQAFLKISPESIQLLVEKFLAFKQISTDEVILYFIDKKTISSLHEDYFRDPNPTDCISFPMDRPGEDSVGYHILGEVFICPEVAFEYAEKHNLSVYDELSMYVIHGLLHLLGYDDLSPSEEKIMREEEKRCMKILRQQDALIDENSAN